MADMHLRRIPLEGAHNFRDLGGYPSAGGRMTRWGVAYRSDSLDALTEGDWQTLSALGVRTVVDLRSAAELGIAKLELPAGISYENYSLMAELDALAGQAGSREDMARSGIVKSMELDYGKTLFGNIGCVAGILNAIAAGLEKGSVVFLCSAGKDRTGIVAALLLYLCGVAREDIVADYMVSGTYNRNGINKKLEQLSHSDAAQGIDLVAVRGLLESRPETVEALLDEMEVRDVRARLAEHGFTCEQQARLVERLVSKHETSSPALPSTV